MASVDDVEFTILSDREIAGTGLGTSPSAVSSYSDMQRFVFQLQPADTKAVEAKAGAAQESANAAQATGDAAQSAADGAQVRADDAYTLAEGKVTKTTLTSPAAYSGTASATYAQAEVQALMEKVASLTVTVQQIVAALKV